MYLDGMKLTYDKTEMDFIYAIRILKRTFKLTLYSVMILYEQATFKKTTGNLDKIYFNFIK